MNHSWKIRIWKNGAHVDMWSVNHILAGVILFGLAVFSGLGFWTGLIIATVLMIGWEIYEVFAEIIETKSNRFFDVFLGIVGYLIVFFLHAYYLSESNFIVLFYASLLGWIALHLWGLHAEKIMKTGV